MMEIWESAHGPRFLQSAQSSSYISLTAPAKAHRVGSCVKVWMGSIYLPALFSLTFSLRLLKGI